MERKEWLLGLILEDSHLPRKKGRGVDVEIIMKKLYIDTNLIVAYYYPKDTEKQHEISKNFFEKTFKDENIKLFCSNFTIAEFTYAYVTKKGITDVEAHRIANALLITNKIGKKYPFILINAEGNKENYSFNDFFLDIQTILLDTKQDRVSLMQRMQ